MKPIFSLLALSLALSTALFLAMSCATTPPRVTKLAKLQASGMRPTLIPAQPKSLWLNWSNRETWIVNIVDYKTNLDEPWQFYCYVTNAYTNDIWLKLENTHTNAQCYFRFGTVGFW